MNADKEQTSRLLKTARGQIDGILKMVEEDRYCMDVSNQILAAVSILSKVNREIVRAHMQTCVVDSIREGGQSGKIDEIMALIDKLAK
jgi:DNA-binding FrmR family transcriptional regulator